MASMTNLTDIYTKIEVDAAVAFVQRGVDSALSGVSLAATHDDLVTVAGMYPH